MPRVVHFDISADQPERALKFYTKAFDWQFSKWDGPFDYWLIRTGVEEEPGIDGGMGVRSNPDAGITSIINVPSVDEYAARVVAAGGTILAPKQAIPGVGYLVNCKDTEGNGFAIMEDDEYAA